MRTLTGKATLAAVLAAGLLAAAFAPAADRDLRSGITSDGIDARVRPQDDLFRHINGGWIARATIPPEYGQFGSFMLLRDNALKDLRAIIEDAAKQDAPAGSDARKIGDLYNAFLDEDRAEKLGIDPIKDDFAKIDAVSDRTALLRLISSLEPEGVGGPFRFYVSPDAKQSDRQTIYLSQGGLSLPDESYYRDEQYKEIREAFVEHVAKMFELAGRKDPAGSAKQVMELETRLAKHHWDRVKSRNQTLAYNKKDRAALDALTPGLDWAVYFEGVGAKDVAEVIVRQPDYFQAMAKALQEVPLDQWKTWLAWHALDGAASYLNKAIVDEDFAFARKLTGATELPPRWKRGVQAVEGALGESAGKLYVAKHFPPAAKVRMQQLVNNLIEAYRRDIQSLDWMSPETKKKALEKLAKFTPKIGYPDKWRDYSKLEIRRDDLVGNIRRANAFEFNRDLAKLGKPVDRSEWGMTPQTVNAYYNPLFNEIVFPAAILQPPFFDMKADDAVNYGGIGAVIGHEIGHGFDDQGSKYDGDGNMKNWWTDADRGEFEKRAKMLIEQYNGFAPAQLPDKHVNGALTIGENIGDLGGLTIAYKAYKIACGDSPAPVLDGLTGDQRFFIGWAQVWRTKFRDAELLRRLTIDPHSPAEFRCNGVVRNLPEFYEAFGVKQGDKLWLPPQQRVRIW